MARPVLVKLGGSLVTDKTRESTFNKVQARRLLQEIAKAGLPTVVLHGAGSYGHPQALRAGLDRGGPVDDKRRNGVAETLAAVSELGAMMVDLAFRVGLKPIPVPLHLALRIDAGEVTGWPTQELTALLTAGYTPMLHGTLVRGARDSWSVLSADRILSEVAPELNPRIALFVTDVDGVHTTDPRIDPASPIVPRLRVNAAVQGVTTAGQGADATGRMAGKLEHAFAAARSAPTFILNGTVKGRLLDALHGKVVPGTWIEASAKS